MKTLLIPVNRWPVFVVSLTLAFAGSLPAQSPFLRDDSDDPQYSDAYRRRLRELRERVAEERRERQERIDGMRERGEQIRQRLDDEYRERQERRLRERREELERRLAEARTNAERLRNGYGSYAIPPAAYAVPRITPNYSYYYRPSRYSSYSLDNSDECDEEAKEELRRQQEEEEGFAAASGKCGDVTTQKIGNFFYHSDGTVTQKVGNFFYGPDGQVTQKVGNFYYHSDGTITQRVGNFYYDSDGGVTQKIGSFYYHSGGKPCEDDEEN